jgi:pimeloyl-ACP methyl ester carboxylesterase
VKLKLEQVVEFSQFGSDDGNLVVYFHGAPGSPEECKVFDLDGKKHGLKFVCFDRFAVDPSIKGEAYYKFLAAEISKLAGAKQVDFVGFSIGAFIALQTSRYMNHYVRNLHLISAAAPLESGHYLDAMAGKQVFKLAKVAPFLFLLLSHWQGLLVLFSPKALFNLLFASAAGEDKALAAAPEFQHHITQVIRTCFVGRVKGYARDIDAYVQPWNATLSEVSVNTQLWHGDMDNWSPPLMMDYLKNAIPGNTSANLVSGASHYSCLYRAVAEICSLLQAH